MYLCSLWRRMFSSNFPRIAFLLNNSQDRVRPHLCRNPGRREKEFRAQSWNFPLLLQTFVSRKRALNAMVFVQDSSRNFDSRRSRMRCARGWCWSAARFVSWGSPATGSDGSHYSCSAKGTANAVGSFRPN